MIISKGLPIFLWDEAISHANYLQNKAPTRALEGKTPEEAWKKKKPNISRLREWGSNMWILDESHNRHKLQPKSRKMILMGFNDGSKSVRYYDTYTRTIKVSRNFTFNENEEPKEWKGPAELPGLQAEGEILENSAQQTSADNIQQVGERPSTPPNQQTVAQNQAPTRNLRDRTKIIGYKLLDNPNVHIPTPQFIQPEINEPTASSNAKTTIQEQVNMAISETFSTLVTKGELSYKAVDPDTPNTAEEALTGPEAAKWKAAMDEEYNTLQQMGTWKLTDLPKGWKTIGCRWVFLRKRDKKGKVIKFKAQLVAQGFSQKPGTDYSNDGTFAPVM